MSRFLDIINDFMVLRGALWLTTFHFLSVSMDSGYNIEQIDGSVSDEKRHTAIENFQRPDSDVFAFLLTTKAGGIGLNLVSA